ncbi:hypothetical protein KKH27_08955 [bacterium]|nr:hypothetical protein [bacterium]MBU1983808.1 hypothetical protein [bacterium]
MNWKLIFVVSLLGVLIGLVSLFGLVDLNQWFIAIMWWLIAALILGRFAHKKYFGHGLWTGVIESLVSSTLIYLFFDTYVANNPKVAEQLAQLPPGVDARSMMLINMLVGVIIGGVVLGLLTLLSGKVFGEPEPQPTVELPMESPPPTEDKPDQTGHGR